MQPFTARLAAAAGVGPEAIAAFADSVVVPGGAPQADGTRKRGPAGPPRPSRSAPIPLSVPYSKELRLLQHVLDNATPGDAASVCDAIEQFGEEVLSPHGQWLKIAGATKATVLTSAMRGAPGAGSILEIGAYCGYSALRMALALPGVRIVTLEVDPAHMVIARNVVAFAGLCHQIDVWTGHSKDLLPRIPDRYGGPGKFKLRGVFMDQRGSRYDQDLAVMEGLGLLLPHAVIVADNVLKPGSPLFLWRLINGGAYDTKIVSMREFAMPSEDWMSVSVRRPAPAGASDADAGDAVEAPSPPPELTQLEWESDRIRAQAMRSGQGVTYQEWSAYAEQMKERLAPWGIAASVEGSSLEGGASEELVARPPNAAPIREAVAYSPLPEHRGLGCMAVGC